jgi:hypothetical protein
MATSAQKRASASHRRRASARGLVRVEVQAQKSDAGLIRALATALRAEPNKARAIRAKLESVLAEPTVMSALEAFGSDLPEEVFEGVFDQPREIGWREIDL